MHPAIYQFIREQDVGGTQRFVFGKHSGAAAVEAVLTRHGDLLAGHGIAIDETLVARVLDRVKELRERTIAAGASARAVRAFYENYERLGVSEAALIEIALETGSQTRSRV